jgi:hypothetical protein
MACCLRLRSMVLVVVALPTTTERCDSMLLAAADLRALLETGLPIRRAMEALPRKRLVTASDCCSWLAWLVVGC